MRRAAALLTALALTGCGGTREPSDEEKVRATLTQFADATAKKDYQRLCDDVFATELVRQVAQVLPCEAALQRSDLGAAEDSRIEIRSVQVDGESATAKVRSSAANQKPSEDTVSLVKEQDGWRIVALAS